MEYYPEVYNTGTFSNWKTVAKNIDILPDRGKGMSMGQMRNYIQNHRIKPLMVKPVPAILI